MAFHGRKPWHALAREMVCPVVEAAGMRKIFGAVGQPCGRLRCVAGEGGSGWLAVGSGLGRPLCKSLHVCKESDVDRVQEGFWTGPRHCLVGLLEVGYSVDTPAQPSPRVSEYMPSRLLSSFAVRCTRDARACNMNGDFCVVWKSPMGLPMLKGGGYIQNL